MWSSMVSRWIFLVVLSFVKADLIKVLIKSPDSLSYGGGHVKSNAGSVWELKITNTQSKMIIDDSYSVVTSNCTLWKDFQYFEIQVNSTDLSNSRNLYDIPKESEWTPVVVAQISQVNKDGSIEIIVNRDTMLQNTLQYNIMFSNYDGSHFTLGNIEFNNQSLDGFVSIEKICYPKDEQYNDFDMKKTSAFTHVKSFEVGLSPTRNHEVFCYTDFKKLVKRKTIYTKYKTLQFNPVGSNGKIPFNFGYKTTLSYIIDGVKTTFTAFRGTGKESNITITSPESLRTLQWLCISNRVSLEEPSKYDSEKDSPKFYTTVGYNDTSDSGAITIHCPLITLDTFKEDDDFGIIIYQCSSEKRKN